MTNHLQELTNKLKGYNLSDKEKQALKLYLQESVARESLDILEKDPHWEELDYTLQGKADQFFNDIVDITISWHYCSEDIIALDNAIIALL